MWLFNDMMEMFVGTCPTRVDGFTSDVFDEILVHLLARYTHHYEQSVTSCITQRFAVADYACQIFIVAWLNMTSRTGPRSAKVTIFSLSVC